MIKEEPGPSEISFCATPTSGSVHLEPNVFLKPEADRGHCDKDRYYDSGVSSENRKGPAAPADDPCPTLPMRAGDPVMPTGDTTVPALESNLSIKAETESTLNRRADVTLHTC